MTGRQVALDKVPQSRLTLDELKAMRERHAQLANQEYVKDRLVEMGVTVVNSVELPPDWIADPIDRLTAERAQEKGDKFYAKLKMPPATAGVRSDVAMTILSEAMTLMPPARYARFADQAREKLFVSGGVQCAMGRFLRAYPTPEKRAKVLPVSRAEAEMAVRCEGIPFFHESTMPIPPPRRFCTTPEMVEKYKLDPESVLLADLGQFHNKHGDNGFPVGLTLTEENAASMVFQLGDLVLEKLADGVKTVVSYASRPEPLQQRGGADISPTDLARISNGVRQGLENMEQDASELVLVKMKAKADIYKKSKVISGDMRLYAVAPRHILAVMALATQNLPATNAIQALKVPVPAGYKAPWLTTVNGSSLAHGGASDIVYALDQNLDNCAVHNPRREIKNGEFSYAHVHVGDDCWMVVRINTEDGSRLYRFALDGSNFDLTLTREVLRPIRKVIGEQLQRIHPIGGAVWEHFSNRRQTLMSGNLVALLEDANPSGIYLVTETNGCISTINAERIGNGLLDLALAKRRQQNMTAQVGQRAMRPGCLPPLTLAEIEEVVAKKGTSMGIELRCEQLEEFPGAHNVLETLVDKPFVFLGYEFSGVTDVGIMSLDEVHVQAEPARSMAQFPYPGVYTKDNELYREREVGRLLSLCLSNGEPSNDMIPFMTAYRKKILDFADSYLQHQATDGGLRTEAWDANGPRELIYALDPKLLAPGLKGLRAAAARDPRVLWTEPSTLTDKQDTLPLAHGDPLALQVDPVTLADKVRKYGFNKPKKLKPATPANAGKRPAKVKGPAPAPIMDEFGKKVSKGTRASVNAYAKAHGIDALDFSAKMRARNAAIVAGSMQGRLSKAERGMSFLTMQEDADDTADAEEDDEERWDSLD